MFEYGSRLKGVWFLTLDRKIQELEAALPKIRTILEEMKISEIWTRGLTEEEKKDTKETFPDFFKEDLGEAITGEELYTAMEEGIVTEIEISKKEVKELQLIETVEDLYTFYIENKDNLKIGAVSEKYVETIFREQYNECVFCKEKMFGEYKNCPYCGAKKTPKKKKIIERKSMSKKEEKMRNEWIIPIEAKIREIEATEAITKLSLPLMRGTPIWTEPLNESERKMYFTDPRTKDYIKKDSAEIITGDDVFSAIEEGIPIELEKYKNELKELELAERAEDLLMFFIEHRIRVIGKSEEEYKKMVKKRFKNLYDICPFCKEKSFFLNLGICINCEADIKKEEANSRGL